MSSAGVLLPLFYCVLVPCRDDMRLFLIGIVKRMLYLRMSERRVREAENMAPEQYELVPSRFFFRL